MVPKEILGLARKVRAVVRRWAKNNISVDYNNMAGACAIASYTLYKVLEEAGYDPEFCCTYNDWDDGHCWVSLGNSVIDLTATQFCTEMPKIYVETYPNYRKFLEKHVPNSRKPLKNIWAIKETMYWNEQSPLKYQAHIKRLIDRLRTCQKLV